MSPSLPPKAGLEQLRKQAKDLLKAHKQGDPSCCAVFRWLKQFAGKSDANILSGAVSLVEVQFALAMDYGFKSWGEMKDYVEALGAMRAEGLPLAASGSLAQWVIGSPEDARIEGDVWVFTGDPENVRWEVGGMSWDNYVLSADVQVARTAPDGTYRVQLTGRGTTIFCQLVPGWIVLAYIGEGFTHVGKQKVHVPDGVWVNFRMKAEGGTITAFLDGREIVSAAIPCGTQGMPGLLVNGQKGAVVRIKNVRVEFLNPTPEQIAEYRTSALENWHRWVARHGDVLPDSRRAGEREPA